ncbi:MAG: EAL domain-containing protein [Clostridia bacterium]|nr:EAL domain-containing protein [Clostridia bacterium]
MKKRKTGKRFLTAFYCVIIMKLFTAPALAAGGHEKDDLIIGVPIDRCPIFYMNEETGEIEGIGADLMRTAAKNAGYSVSFISVKEDTLKSALDNTKYDAVMPFGSAIPSAAEKSTIVSQNLFRTPFTLVTVGKRTLPRLNNLCVGMLRSQTGVAETIRSLYPGIDISMYETMPECVRALRENSVDALLHNSYVWSYVLQKPSYRDLTVQPTTMFSMDFRVGTLDTPEGRDIINRLDRGIIAITDTGRQAVILDYTTRHLYRYDLSDYLYRYGWVMVAFALLSVTFTLFVVKKQRDLRRAGEEQMRQIMEQDKLTGVLSMDGFRRSVEVLLHDHPDIQYLISYNNIRNFKFINDSLGRSAGDELLRFWSQKSMEYMTDEEAIGRISGDHFVILRRINGEEQMDQDERDIINPVRTYFVDRGTKNSIQICSGIYVLTSEDYRNIDVDRMLDYARVAEERVRKTRKDGYEFYNPEQWEKGQRVTYICSQLEDALRSGEVQAWYQPQVNYKTGEIIGAEALCRWNHSKLGWLRPAEFIPILEESDMIFELDKYIWERVCRDLRRWKDQGDIRYVSVNLSRCDMREGRNIPSHFYNLIRTYDLDPSQLRIEITESAYVEKPELLIRTTVKLKEFGFQVEMDDFGSGYSSLHMLKDVPVDRIKLDLKFMSGVGDSEKGRIIVSHIIQMARSLGINMIAEGVENLSQASYLESQDCFEMQGFYFYKPMPVKEFEAIMEQKNP